MKAKKEVVRKITIDYRWWRSDGKPISPDHIEALEESAMDRIAPMMADGYQSGELVDNIRMSNNDPDDGIEYQGWWSVSKKDGAR